MLLHLHSLAFGGTMRTEQFITKLPFVAWLTLRRHLSCVRNAHSFSALQFKSWDRRRQSRLAEVRTTLASSLNYLKLTSGSLEQCYVTHLFVSYHLRVCVSPNIYPRVSLDRKSEVPTTQVGLGLKRDLHLQWLMTSKARLCVTGRGLA